MKQVVPPLVANPWVRAQLEKPHGAKKKKRVKNTILPWSYWRFFEAATERILSKQ